MIELPPPMWLPPRPAIIRPADRELLKLARRDAIKASRREASFLPGMFPAGAAAAFVDPDPPGLALAFIGSNQNLTNTANYSFASQPIGVAAPTRRVVVVVGWVGTASTTNSISSATIGGVAATIHVQASDAAGGSRPGAGIISALVTTGPTATIAVNMTSANCTLMTIEVFRQVKETAGSPHATVSDIVIASGVFSTTINIPATGTLVAGAIFGILIPVNISFVGVTEDHETASLESTFRSAAGHATGLGLQAGRTVSATMTGGEDGALVAMSWG